MDVHSEKKLETTSFWSDFIFLKHDSWKSKLNDYTVRVELCHIQTSQKKHGPTGNPNYMVEELLSTSRSTRLVEDFSVSLLGFAMNVPFIVVCVFGNDYHLFGVQTMG